jgi:hypothetical protein
LVYKTGGKMKTLKFWDLKKRKPFTSSVYKIQVKKGRKFAISKTPSGGLAYLICKKGFKG